MRSVLVTALAARADSSLRVQARQFLRGLSSDELQFIAGFLGACILESAGQQPCLGQLGMPDRRSEDRDL